MAKRQHEGDAPADARAYRTVLELVRLGAAGETDHEGAISEILHCVKTCFDMPRVAVCLIDSDSYTVQYLIDDTGLYQVGDVLPLAGSWCEQVIEQARPILAVCEGSEEFSAYPGLLANNAPSYAGARILVDGKLRGTLNLTAPEPRTTAFNDGDREVLDVAVALVGHRLSLQHAQERFERVLRGSSVGFWEWDVGTDEVYWSPRYLEILGMTGEDRQRTIGAFIDRQHPDDRARIRKAMTDHLERRLPYDIEYRLRREDGEYVWLHARGQAVWDPSGAPRRMAGSVDDVTARKLAEQALQQSEERYELAVRGTGVGIWDWDVATGQVFWSDALRRLLAPDVDAPDLSVESFAERIHEDDRERVLDLLQRHLAGEAEYRVEYRARLPDGNVIWVHTRGQAIWNEAGEPIRMAGSCHDTTARKQAELMTQEQADELRRTNEELQQFASVASHDLQEPLRKITSFGALLAREYADRLDDRGHGLIDRMVDGARRQRELIQDLLDYSRSSNAAMRFESVSLSGMISDICSDFELLIAESGASIESDSDAVLIGDPLLLRQMFQNLLSNSLKYRGEASPQIRISARRSDDELNWRLSVQDNGIGFSSRHATRVFEIFKRLHSRDKFPGTGIGLALCERVVERHGGRIWAESAPGEGTCVNIEWPLTPSAGPELVPTEPAEPSGPASRKL